MSECNVSIWEQKRGIVEHTKFRLLMAHLGNTHKPNERECAASVFCVCVDEEREIKVVKRKICII